jgi:hypothetical protein
MLTFMDICYQCGSEAATSPACCPQCGMAVLSVPASLATGSTVRTSVPGYGGSPTISRVQAGPEFVVSAALRPGGSKVRRPSPRSVIVLGAVLALLIGGGVVAFTVFRPPTATSTVRQYFDELADGDTTAALKLVADPADYSPQDQPFLVPRALSDAHARPRDLRILRTDSTTAVTGEPFETVHVSYRIRQETVGQVIVVTKTQDGDAPYLLEEPFLQLGVSSLAGRQLTVNGIAAPTDEVDDAFVFPGAYTATAQGNALIAGATQAAVVQPGESADRPVAAIDLGTPTLAPGAEEAVQTKVKEQIDACAQSTSSEPSGCPFSVFLFGSDASVKWSITAYPSVTVALSSDPTADEPVTISADADDGVAHYVATYTDEFTGDTQTETGDQSFSVEGTATASGGGITVSIG